MLGERIRKLRTGRGLTMEQFAEVVGVSRQTLSKWEFDETTPSIEKCIVISKVFELTLDEFVYGGDSFSDNENGKYMFGIVNIDENKKVVIPEEACAVFGLAPGDNLLMVGDSNRGIALVKVQSIK